MKITQPSNSSRKIGINVPTPEQQKRLHVLLGYLIVTEQQPSNIDALNKNEEIVWRIDDKKIHVWSKHEFNHLVRSAINPWFDTELITDDSIIAIKKKYGFTRFLGFPPEGIVTYFEGDEAEYYLFDPELTNL